jgi:hypothetical protein
MNKTYRLIWNDFTHTWVAVSEIARARGKSASGAVLLAAAGFIAVPPAPTFAAPPNPPVAIDWQTFNIGSAARVNFIQPSSSAAILNQPEPATGTRGTATL